MLGQGFERLKQYGIVINTVEVVFLGHRIFAECISPSSDKEKAIQNFSAPITMRQMRQFLGLINFYRRLLHTVQKYKCQNML